MAQPPAPSVPMSSPNVVEVSNVNAADGVVAFEVTVMIAVPKTVTVQRIVNVNGQQQTVVENRVVTTFERVVKMVPWALKGNSAFDGSDKKIADADLWKRIKKGDSVIMAQGTTLDERWTKVLKPETIILLTTPAAPSTK
jgi:hypothetical protein